MGEKNATQENNCQSDCMNGKRDKCKQQFQCKSKAYIKVGVEKNTQWRLKCKETETDEEKWTLSDHIERARKKTRREKITTEIERHEQQQNCHLQLHVRKKSGHPEKKQNRRRNISLNVLPHFVPF